MVSPSKETTLGLTFQLLPRSGYYAEPLDLCVARRGNLGWGDTRSDSLFISRKGLGAGINSPRTLLQA
jgi:hypothetical protein